jgi:GNAT superfamily N-acetyltransferase
MAMATVTHQPVVYDQWQVKEAESNSKTMQTYTIQSATVDDVAKIVHVAQEAYFHPKIVKLTNRDPNQKAAFALNDVPRRIRNTDNYQVLVCKMKDITTEDVVGTVYYQPKETDFRDEDGKELAEIGLLAVHPKFWGKGIAERMVKQVLTLAETDCKLGKIRGIYLYAIASHSPEAGYSNSLPKFYEKHGFKFVYNRTSNPSVLYATTDKRAKQVVMLNDLGAKNGMKAMKTILEEISDTVFKEITIPDSSKAKESAAAAPAASK